MSSPGSVLTKLLYEVHEMMAQLASDQAHELDIEGDSGTGDSFDRAGDMADEAGSEDDCNSCDISFPPKSHGEASVFDPGSTDAASLHLAVTRNVHSVDHVKPHEPGREEAILTSKTRAAMLQRLERMKKSIGSKKCLSIHMLKWVNDRVRKEVSKLRFFRDSELDDGIREMLLAGQPFRTTARNVARIIWSRSDLEKLLQLKRQYTTATLLIQSPYDILAKFWCQVLGYRSYEIFCRSLWMTRLCSAIDSLKSFIR